MARRCSSPACTCRGESECSFPVLGDDHPTMYVILWRFRPLVGQEREFENAYGPSGIGHRCLAGATATSARNCSGTPTTHESISPWTAGSPGPPTKRSWAISATSIGNSTTAWKGLQRKRPSSAPSKRYQPEACHPSASAMTPATMAAAAMRRRVESPSESNRAPMAAPMRMEISRAGAT